MNALFKFINSFNFYATGSFMIIFLLGTGIILTIGTKAIQFRKLGYAFKLLLQNDYDNDGDISPFQALSTSLAAFLTEFIPPLYSFSASNCPLFSIKSDFGY